VEDQPSILRMTSLMLECQGYRVLSAGTATEGIRLARESPDKIDLLLTDVVMPEMNGQELARNIRVVHPRIKCLYMSGYAAETISQQDFTDGKTGFIQKPFSTKDMARALREILDST
jgi:CheY-like chemotaxis protein